jgi:hypothetical protein
MISIRGIKIQGFSDSKIPEFDSKIQGFRIQGFKDSGIQGFRDSRIGDSGSVISD